MARGVIQISSLSRSLVEEESIHVVVGGGLGGTHLSANSCSVPKLDYFRSVTGLGEQILAVAFLRIARSPQVT